MTWRPHITRADSQYITDLLVALEEVHRKHDFVGIDHINVYSDGDPLGYISSTYIGGENKTYFYFVAGDEYNPEKDD